MPRLTALLLLACGPAFAGTAEAPAPVDYSGTWTLTSTCSTGSTEAVLTIVRTGPRAFVVTGQASNGEIADGLFVLERVEGINVMRYRSTFLTASRMVGDVTQVTRAELCRWVAVKQ